ncbi:translation initiation factor IF-2 [Aliikangiella coralliicola]|uniref:Translation initiation factor IF-2 n=1 Tax=Aliikangiella coralliicola TaxID=2592383 RepID=A0A545UEB5_9GAMM|nr:translation initiation factor IF-2 [Aliikangiella coralliicola]TQV87820.1 translation initiation factor IF-2 [Aliikangiella coralliicola]
MSEVTVEKLAKIVGTPIDKLLEQMKDAGVDLSGPNDAVSDEQKKTLLAHLKKSHGESASAALGPKKITLKRTTKSSLKMAGTGGKSKTVNVEVRKKRTYVKRADVEESSPSEELVVPEVVEETPVEPELQEENLKAQQAAAEEAKAKAQAEAMARAEAEARAQAEVEARAQAEVETQKQAEEKAKNEEFELVVEPEEDKKTKRPIRKGAVPPAAPPADTLADKSRKKKRKKKKKSRDDSDTPADMLSEFKRPVHRKFKDDKKLSEERRPMVAPKSMKHEFQKPTKGVAKQPVSIPESITVGDLAQKMSVKATEVIKAMMGLGSMATINQTIDQETAQLVAEEMGYEVVLLAENAAELALLESSVNEGEETSRAPVVTIMGHVDHGKTSLLDHIRESKVADGEAGGITQHIGAYNVSTGKGSVTFLDTPGHAAFTAMRARGANATDIVILVVAADDGVMPQTIEAVQHSKAAGVQMIVAVNKIDKEEADPDRVKNELSQHDVIPEDWGGDIPFVHVSAKTGEGVEDLLETISLVAELQELKAINAGPAKGIVIESRLDKGRGVVASVLVQSGELKPGDILLAGFHYGRVRALNDENGKPTDSAGPSIPVEVLGLSGVPEAGDEISVVPDERKAREVANFRQGKYKDLQMAKQQKSKLENMFSNMGSDEKLALNVIVKADVQGSSEALQSSLLELATEEIQVNVISSGVGAITETDITLASASNAIVVGFNVRADATARKAVEREGVDLRYYSVIYDVIDEVKAAMSGMLSPEKKQEIIGLAEVRDVFKSPKLGAIAGCMVIEGIVKRNNPIRVLRDNVVIYEGELESLRRFKDDANEVRNGMECGIGVKNYNDVKVGDQIEVFEIVEVARTL